MKTKIISLWAALLSVAFTLPLHAQLPNAQQITDNSTAAYSGVSYFTNLTTGQQFAATNSGFDFSVNARFTTEFGGQRAMNMIYWLGAKRFLVGFELDGSGDPRLSGAHVDIGAVEAQLASVDNPPVMASPAVSGSGVVTLSVTNVPNLDLTVLAATNVALPLIQWLPIGLMSPGAPGEYQFIDPQAANYPTRFYQTVSP